MDPLSATASVIAILQLSAKVLSYLNDVKDATEGRRQCTIEASNLHNLLTNLRFRLEEGHGHEPWFNAVQTLAVESGPLDQFKQALETLQAKMTDGGRLKKVGDALMWKFKKEEIDTILARMERLKTLVEIALQMDHFKLSQAIKDETLSIRTHVSSIESAVNNVQQVQVTAAQHSLLDWLSPSDYPAQQSDIIKRRQEGTGQWFIDAPEVARWLNNPKTTLFCPGIPGAGKTMLAAVAIDQLLDSAQSSAQSATYGVAYIYCNYKSQADQDIVNILAAILKQLVQNRPSTLGPVETLHHSHAGRGTRPSLDETYNALRDVLARHSYVHIVVDALDECQNEIRRQLCNKLLDLQKGADVRLMVTSRFVPDVEDVFRQASRLEVKASEEDVKRYVIGQMHRLPKCVQNLQDLVQEKVVEAVGGMFLLARLHVDSLAGNTTAKKVKSTLATFSHGAAALDQAYSEALERIEGQQAGHTELAKNVLTWITFAKRPLTTTELCCALAVEPGETELDPDNKPDVDDIVSVCAGLVVVDRESAIIRLVHYTTQEYFERIIPRLSPDGELGIAVTCFTYLSFRIFESGSCATDEEFEERLHRYELLEYAARYCGEHARPIEAKVAHLACKLLSHHGTFSCAAQILFLPFDYRSYRMDGYSICDPALTSLHWIARFGLTEVGKQFLSTVKGNQVRAVNARDGQGRGPMMLAAEYGHPEVVSLLLDKGVDVNVQGGHYGNALQEAAYRGHEAVVRLLLEKGANPNASGGIYNNALVAASEEGHEAVVRLLLDNGANVNAQDVYGNSVLRMVSNKGNDAVAKLLLDNGADVNTQDGLLRGSALQLASYRGFEATVRLLLEHGANVEACGGYYDTPLKIASQKGYGAIKRLLIEHGADLFAAFGRYTDDLERAAYEGDNKSLANLTGKNSASWFKDPYDRTFLWWAAAGGHVTTVQALVDRYNYNPRVPDKFGRTPLWIATKRNRHAVSRFLLEEYGPPDSGQTPLPDHSDGPVSGLCCDVCTSDIRINDFHYHCEHCFGGDWDVCEDCKIRGASCADETHVLFKRKSTPPYQTCD